MQTTLDSPHLSFKHETWRLDVSFICSFRNLTQFNFLESNDAVTKNLILQV